MLARNAVKLLSRFCEVRRKPAHRGARRYWEGQVNGRVVSFCAAGEDRPICNILIAVTDPDGRRGLTPCSSLKHAIRYALRRDGGGDVEAGGRPVRVSVNLIYDAWLRPWLLVWVGLRTFSTRDHPGLAPLARAAIDAGEYRPLLDWLLEHYPEKAEEAIRSDAAAAAV